MNNLLFEIKNLVNFFILRKDKKKIVFYSESLFYKNYYIDLFFEIKKNNPNVLILTSDINEYYFLKKENIEAYFIGNGIIKLIIFNFIKCNFFIMTMTDIGNNLKRSKSCKNYVYFFHALASTHVIYTPKAFNNYDIIFTNGDYQHKEIRKNEEIFELKKKILIDSGYFYLDYLKRNANLNLLKTKQILFAPTWNYNQKNLFNDRGYAIIKNLIDSNFKVHLRLHPEIIKRDKNKFNEIINLFGKSNLFSLDQNPSNLESMEQASLLITDNSSIGMEFALVFKRPVLYIDYSKKIHNKNHDKFNLTPLEDSFKELIGFTINSSQVDRLSKICNDIIKKTDKLKDKISNFEKINLQNIGHSAKKAASYILEHNS